MPWPDPVKLTGKTVTLEPLSQDHCRELARAAEDGKLWELWYTLVPPPDKMEAEIERRLNMQTQGALLPFTVISNETGNPCGMTSYLNIDATARRLEIGMTWYCASVQRTALNTEAKVLLLSHAFEKLNCIAVEFRTSFFNQRSRRAIERLGAKLDGILRNHTLHRDGTIRDTCVYSIICSEWPAVKTHLNFLIEKRRHHREKHCEGG